MLSPINAAFGAIALAAMVTPLMYPAAKEVSEQDRLVAAFESAGAQLEKADAPADVLHYSVAFSGCATRGALLLAGYGRRNEIRELAQSFDGDLQIFFSGLPAPSLSEGELTRAYVFDQLASKSGFRQDGPWSRRLTVFQPPRGCDRPVSLTMHSADSPGVRR